MLNILRLGRALVLVALLNSACSAPSRSPTQALSADAVTVGLSIAGGNVVDNSTLTGKMLFGYQGWFSCPQDGSEVKDWVHWFRASQPTAENLNVEMWPDVSELGSDELFSTSMTYADGRPAQLYSAYKRSTVVRHFKWMQDYGLDGAMLQRFLGEIQDPRFFAFRNQVTANVREGAEAYGRVFAIEYDTSMAMRDEANLVPWLERDWQYMVDVLKVTESPNYLRHNGKPVLFIWGLGFTDRPGSAEQAAELIAWLKNQAASRYQVTLVGGVPTHWRTLSGDAKSAVAWTPVYHSFDIISPWTVGRYHDEESSDRFQNEIVNDDMAETQNWGIGYMPVIFPGFSWRNLNHGPLNEIPRHGGRFYWRQLYNVLSAGATMVKTAMFDEVDEGTAMYKIAATASAAPAQGTYLTLDADAQSLPSDWYLQVACQGSRMLRGDLPLTAQLPSELLCPSNSVSKSK